jgi:hypothetical protein
MQHGRECASAVGADDLRVSLQVRNPAFPVLFQSLSGLPAPTKKQRQQTKAERKKTQHASDVFGECDNTGSGGRLRQLVDDNYPGRLTTTMLAG